MTLNQVIRRIKAIAESHDQINTFFFGDADEFYSSDIVFPACFLSMPSEIGGKGATTLSFSLFCLDRQIQGGNNELEVLSDMREVCLDLQAMFKYGGYVPSWIANDDFTITYFNEKDEDYLAGCKLDFTLRLHNAADRCQVPTNFDYAAG